MAASALASEFGAHLRELRLRAGLTQEMLATHTGLSKRAIQHLERGLGQPHRETSRRLAEAFALAGEQLVAFEKLAAPAPRRRRQTGSEQLSAPINQAASREVTSADGGSGQRLQRESEALGLSLVERKQVTVVVAEIVEPAALFQSVDLADALNLLDAVLRAMRSAVHQFHGTVTRIDHDGMTVLFGATTAATEDAYRACRAALAMRDAVRQFGAVERDGLAVVPHVRIGLASGEVALRTVNAALSADYMVAGLPIHSASRLARLTPPDCVWMEIETAQMVDGQVQLRELAPMTLPGLELPIAACELRAGCPEMVGAWSGLSQARW